MATTALSLPIDIPWERIGVSKDMIDASVCDNDRPSKWQTSIAIFKYVPDEDYQTFPNRKITYVKITCTLAGYQPKSDEIERAITDLSKISLFTFDQDELERKLANYVPCNEALIQVTVGPKSDKKIDLNDYPYFMDFQPKKREMYEAVSKTNEFMSRSLETLDIKKSAGTTKSQEVLDIDKGFTVGVDAKAGGTGAGVQYSKQGEWGTKQLSNNESGLVRTTDESRERRETVSHTTQLTQLYHLLDSYHLGTNRAVFFVQPNPNTQATSSGFVNGPRPIDGIQEFFLIVNQPQDQEDFCLDVRLDTGHLFETAIFDYDHKTDQAQCILSNPPPKSADADAQADGDTIQKPEYNGYHADVKYRCFKRPGIKSEQWKPAQEGYIIDLAKDGGYKILDSTHVDNATYKVSVTPDGEMLEIICEGTSTACYKVEVVENSLTQVADSSVWDVITNGLTLGASGALQNIVGNAIYTAAPARINERASQAEVYLEVYLRSRLKSVDTGKTQKTFAVVSRSLCTCGEEITSEKEGHVYQGSLNHLNLGDNSISKRSSIPTNSNMTSEEAQKLQRAIRDEMLLSIVSPRRTEPQPFENTKMYMDIVLQHLVQQPHGNVMLNQSAVDLLPRGAIASAPNFLKNAINNIKVYDLLVAPPEKLSILLGSEMDTHTFKSDLFSALVRSITQENEVDHATEEADAPSSEDAND